MYISKIIFTIMTLVFLFVITPVYAESDLTIKLKEEKKTDIIKDIKEKTTDIFDDFFKKPEFIKKNLPTAKINSNPLHFKIAMSFDVPKTIRISGKRSKSDSKISKYKWQIINLNDPFKKEDNQVIATFNKIQVVYTFQKPGFYKILLSVYDPEGNVSSSSVLVWAR